jgi:microcystin-dependent protein
MSQPFVGEIRMFGGSFAPAGWAFCNGAIMPIAENETLFNLIGTTYGGDGQATFALPNLQSRFPMHNGTLAGNTFVIGETGGVEQVTLTTQQIPVHSHTPVANDLGGGDSPNGTTWGKSTTGKPYANVAGGVPAALNTQTVSITGGSQPHENMHPYLCITFIISLFGVFPSPN